MKTAAYRVVRTLLSAVLAFGLIGVIPSMAFAEELESSPIETLAATNVEAEGPAKFVIEAQEDGSMIVNNRWTGNIVVIQDSAGTTVAPGDPLELTVVVGEEIIVEESEAGSTFRGWDNNHFPFVKGTSCAITSMPPMSAFTEDQAGTIAGDNFFCCFNLGSMALAPWYPSPAGTITSFPDGSFDTSNITTVGDDFFDSFNDTGYQVASLPDGSFNTFNITTVGDNFFRAFNRMGSIASLPAGSFDISNIKTVGNGFFQEFNSDGHELASLPEGSFDASGITTVGDDFFREFNDYMSSLTSLPKSFALPLSLDSVGTGYCYHMLNSYRITHGNRAVRLYFAVDAPNAFNGTLISPASPVAGDVVLVNGPDATLSADYEFSASTTSVALTTSTPSSSLTITSTKDLAEQGWVVIIKPDWLKADISGDTLTLSFIGEPYSRTNPDGYSDNVILFQVESTREILIDVSCAFDPPIANGWYQLPDKRWLYFEDSVPVKNAWRQTNGLWYYLDPSGTMLTGSLMSDGRYYFCASTGAMQTGWQLHSGGWRYHLASGAEYRGWLAWNGVWYYLDPADNGLMAVSKRLVVDDKTYAFNNLGRMLTGWVNTEGDWRYYNTSGAEVSGWILVGGYWFYLDPEDDNIMVSDVRMTIDDKTYLFNGIGRMQSGWVNTEGDWRYYNNYEVSGWVFVGGYWFYLDPEDDNIMVADTRMTIGDKTYLFNGIGRMVTGWVLTGTDWRYYSTAGATLGQEFFGWLSVGGYWYFLDPENDNIMATGDSVFAPFREGLPLYSDFDANGRWLRYSAEQ